MKRFSNRWRVLLDQYHIGDARSIPSLFPAKEAVDTTITSPPYWNLKDYGSRKQIGYGQTYEEYLDELEEIFRSIYTITKRTGSLWIISDTIKSNGELKLFPFDLASRLKRIGWILQDVIIWHKDKTLPWSHRGKLRNIFEYILFFSKSTDFKYFLSRVREAGGLKRWWVRYPERYSPLGKAPTRTWSIPIPRQGSWGDNWVRHFCPLPPELVRRTVLLSTRAGDLVLDPFAGSGVVLAQSYALGRRFIGLDLRKRYRRMFQNRVLPSLLATEARGSTSRTAQVKQKRKHAGLIWRLRKLKYSRELVRLYDRKFGKLRAGGLLVLALSASRTKIVIFFPPNRKPPRLLDSNIKTLMRVPPLSKYGLRPEMSTVRINGNVESQLKRRGLLRGRRLFLYSNGRTYKISSMINIVPFVEALKNNVRGCRELAPPIASNISVRVPRKLEA